MSNQDKANNGAVDMYLLSQHPLNKVDDLLTAFEKLPYFQKTQIVLTPGQSVAWTGATFHGIHKNTSGVPRFSAYWVFKVEGWGHPYKAELKTLKEFDRSHYGVGFKWITTHEQHINWRKENNLNVYNIAQQIDMDKVVQVL